MKIIIKSNKQNLKFYFPTRLIFSRTAARIANIVGRKYASDTMSAISPEALETLCTELGKIKKCYGKWDLVDIESSDGSIIKIIL